MEESSRNSTRMPNEALQATVKIGQRLQLLAAEDLMRSL